MGALQGIFNGAVVQNYKYAAVSGFTIGVNPGIAIDNNGNLLVQNAQQNVTGTDPGSGNTRMDLVVARLQITNDSPINLPTNPFTPVYLDELYGCQIVLIEGTVNGSYPAYLAGDVVLFGVTINHAGVLSVDYTQRMTGDPPKTQVRQVSVNDVATGVDRIIEMTTGASNLTETLPPPNAVPGKEFILIKTDSGAGTATLAATGLISGATGITIDSQYGSVRCYSNGTTYFAF